MIGDSEDEDEEEEEGEGMDHQSCGHHHHVNMSSDHDQIGYSGPDGLRRRPPAMGEVGRKVTQLHDFMCLSLIGLEKVPSKGS